MPILNFCRMVAENITSEHNQHVTLMIVAPTGKGKSWAGIAIEELVAQFVAEILGGKESDYFTIDNIAIITQQEIIRLLKNRLDVRHSVIGFDDIGVGWNARNFMDEFNKTMNDIYQTFRTRNCFLYVTLPDPRLIDVVPRDMVKYIMEVHSSKHDEGYVECKIFEVAKNMRKQTKLYPYIMDYSGNKIKRHIIFAPSAAYTVPYEVRRTAIEKMNSDKAIENLQTILTEATADTAVVKNEAKIQTTNDQKYLIVKEIVSRFHVMKKEALEIANLSEVEFYRRQKKDETAS